MFRINLRKSVGLRILIVGFLTIVLLLPVGLVMELVTEREVRRNEAFQELGHQWGGAQVLTGPILVIPYQMPVSDNKGSGYYRTSLYLLPDKYKIRADVKPERRYRGIYEFALYKSAVDVTGNFMLPDFAAMNIALENVLWNEAYVTTRLSDLKGLREMIRIKWNDREYIAEPGKHTDAGPVSIETRSGRAASSLNSSVNRTGSSIEIRPVIDAGTKEYYFAFRAQLDGSSDLQFVPLGRETNVSISAPWAHPNFIGEYLPAEHKISDSEFTANWKILYLNRNFPQSWTNNESVVPENAAFGVRLMLPVNEYQQTMRTAKYAILFIGFTFIAFFMLELLNKKAMHPIQYLMVGSALVIFYILLLSVSEQFSFNLAYCIASIAVVLLVTLYTRSALRSTGSALTIAGVMSLLYGILYVILQLEDMSLIFGSVGLFAALALVMYLTRRIDWFALGEDPAERQMAPPGESAA